MSDHENYSVFNADREELRRLVCESYAELHDGAAPSEEEIETSCAIWEHAAKSENTSALECVKRDRELGELEKKIDAESLTCEERRRRIENELGIPTEEQGTLDIAQDDFEWLEAKTGCRNEEVHRLISENDRLIQNYFSWEGKDRLAYEKSAEELESILSREKGKLQAMLKRQQEQGVKPAVNVLAKHTTPCARTASRARRAASSPTFAQGGGGDDGDSDSSGDSDPPGPVTRARYLHPLTSHFKRNLRYLNRRLPRCCWRVAERGRAA